MMKLLVWISIFVLSGAAMAASGDENEDDETEESSLEEIAAEAKALELLGEGPEPSAPELGLDADALLENARGEIDANPRSTLPVQATPPALEQTIDASPSVRQEEPPGVKELPPERETAKPRKTPTLYQGQQWRHQYHSGRELSKKGFVMGGVGAGLVAGGFLLIAIDGANYGAALASGILVGAGGLGTIWVGSGVAAAGTYRTHSALAKGGLVSPVCVGCIGAWATAVYPPTVPVSYLISFSKRLMLVDTYNGARQSNARSSGVKVSPVLTRFGPGLGLTGAF